MVAAGVHPWRETHNVNKVSLEDVAAEAGPGPQRFAATSARVTG